MKKYVFSLLAIVLALFMVACDPSTPPQIETEDDFSPVWAVSEKGYTGKVLGSIDTDLSITADQFRIEVPNILTVDSSVDEVLSNDHEGESWTIVLSNITALGTTYDTVTAVITPAAEGETYDINVIVTLAIENATDEEQSAVDTINGMLASGIQFTEKFAPVWAVSEKDYTGKVLGAIDANLSITADQFKIEVLNVLTVDSTVDEVLSNECEGETWTIVLSNITALGTTYDTVTAVITPVAESEEYNINVLVTLAIENATDEEQSAVDTINGMLASGIQFKENAEEVTV